MIIITTWLQRIKRKYENMIVDINTFCDFNFSRIVRFQISFSQLFQSFMRRKHDFKTFNYQITGLVWNLFIVCLMYELKGNEYNECVLKIEWYYWKRIPCDMLNLMYDIAFSLEFTSLLTWIYGILLYLQ